MECEIPEFYSIKEPVAASPRKCCECKAPINAGEKYVYCAGKWDGELNSFSQHVLCCEACEFIRDRFRGHECIGFGSLKEWWREDGRHIERHHDGVKEIREMMTKVFRRERREGKR